jgi:hypothetical protein
LEYAVSEILEAAGNGLGKRKRIHPPDIVAAIRSDAELSKLLPGFSVFTGDRLKDVSKAVTLPKPKLVGEDDE